jgi:DNA-binding response OmpR family regulator
MNTDAHLLVVDDDPDIRDTLSDYLGDLGYRVSAAEDGRAMRQLLERVEVDLVILDLNMPGEDGFSLVPYLRQRTNAGIIMLTGSGDRVNEVVGLELGADDYVSKPCDMRHLAARIRAVLRRAGPAASGAGNEAKKVLRFAGWELDVTGRELRSPAGEEVPLTTAEFDLLAAFASRPNRVLNRDQLLELLHGREWNPYDRSIDNLISRLRRKLGDDPKRPKLVKSVRGVGYVFTADG